MLSRIPLSPLQKAKLLLLAMLVEAFYLLLAFIPAASLALACAVFYGPTVALAIGAILLLIVAWWIRPDPIDDRGDIAVAADSDLHAAVVRLAAQLDAPRIDALVLTDDLNASAYASGFLGPFGTHRKLSIGIPLLRLLSADELRAVIAHELGHFSRRHSRLAHWIYRVQSKWGLYLLMPRDADDGFMDSAQKLMAQWLIPYFIRQAETWSIQCEFEADTSAGQAGLSEALIAALVKLESFGYLWHRDVRQAMLQWQLDSDTPPADVLEKMHGLVRQRAAASFDAVLQHAAQYPRRFSETHPRLQERADALATPLAPPDMTLACAGESLLADAWDGLWKAHQARWLSAHDSSWRFAHCRYRWLRAQADARPEDSALQAISCATFSNAPDALNPLRALVAEQPTNAHLQYELGRRLLEADDDGGLPHLQQAMQLNKKMALAALPLVYARHAERGTLEQIARAMTRLNAAQRWADGFLGNDLWKRFCTEPLQALPPAGRSLFATAMQAEPRIDGCWAGSLQSKLHDGMRFTLHLIVFRLDNTDIHTRGNREEEVCRRVAGLLRAVSPPDEMVEVKAVLFSETFNPNLLANLEKYPEVCIVKPTRPFNQSVVKIDSL